MSAHRRLCSACASAQSGHGLLCAEGSFGLPCGGYDQATQAGLGLYRAQ